MPNCKYGGNDNAYPVADFSLLLRNTYAGFRVVQRERLKYLITLHIYNMDCNGD